MDYLPLPDGVAEHMLVPELPGIPYDNLGFNGYDVRQGWNIKLLRQGNIPGSRAEWNDYSQAALASYGDSAHEFGGEQLVQLLVGPLLQNWIIYGLFQEALGRPIARDEVTLTRADDHGGTRRYLTLKSLFGEFSARKEELARDTKWQQEFPAILEEVTWILGDIDALHDELGGPVVPGPTAIALSALVCTMRDHAIIWCHPHILSISGSTRVRWLEYQLRDRGWCLEKIRRLRVELGPEGLYYASLLGEVHDGAQHGNCTESLCVAYNVDSYDVYEQTHDARYCDCKDETCKHDVDSCARKVAYDVESLVGKIRQSVMNDRIPLISARYTDRGPELDVTDSHEGEDYIAISHVWSDGMGNPHQNSILPCQIRRLDFCVRKVLDGLKPGTAPKYWLDTICVPLAPREARNRAIRNMHHVYVDARAVLVITQDVISQPLPRTFQETIVRICQSKWFKRLWTMQEGILAKSLAFQFQDHAIDYGFLDDRLHAEIHATTTASALVGSRANLMVSALTTLQGSDKSREDVLDSFWTSIRHRSTSRLTDQAICGSILTGIDLRPVLAADDDKKMEVFWKTYRDIPMGVFWANGPRFDHDAMRWAPKSFLHPSTWALSLHRTGLNATALDDGLHFSGVNAHYLEAVDLPTLEDSMVELQFPGNDTPYAILLAKRVDNPSWSSLLPVWKTVCLLWRELPDLAGFSQGVLVSCPEASERELCGEPSEWHTGVLRARWLAQIDLFVRQGEWAEFIESFPTRYSESGDHLPRHTIDVAVPPSRTRPISKEREWCIY